MPIGMKIQLYLGDCLHVMPKLPDGCVDAIIADLPYGLTELEWDTVIPFDALWREYWRLLKPNGAVVLTAVQPFSARLVCSQIEYYKYSWYWRKPKPSGFVHAKNMPLRDCEEMCVFSKGKVYHSDPKGRKMPYFPQGTVETSPRFKRGRKVNGQSVFRNTPDHEDYYSTVTNYPRQVLDFACEPKPMHATQKPVELMEYLIKTYTRPGAVVLDNTMGSGTTGVACVNTGRKFVGIEKERAFFEAAKARIYGLTGADIDESAHVIGARKTHFLRSSKQELAILAAIATARKAGKKITKTMIAEAVGISRQQISQRYGHLFAGEGADNKISGANSSSGRRYAVKIAAE